MLGREYDQVCSIARTLEVLGERWTLLIIRDVFDRRRRFEQIQENLGIARNVLAGRLAWLVEQGILEKRRYQEHPPRYEYFLTERGLDLWPVMVSLLHWGDRHLAAGDGPPMVIRHKACGGAVDDRRICERCGAHLGVREATVEYGPGAPADGPARAA
jgi:DNA-binding HxlR family transcriptional regulator